MLYFIEHILFLKQCAAEGNSETLENWEKALHYVSLSVLALFVIEVSLKLYAFGLRYLFKLLNIFEFIIVFGGFLAEVLLPNIGGDIATLLIALRMIRLIRFAHAFQESFEKEKDYEISLLKKEIMALKTRLGYQDSNSLETLTIIEPKMVPPGYKIADISFDASDPWDAASLENSELFIFKVPMDFPTLLISGKKIDLNSTLKIKNEKERSSYVVEDLIDLGELDQMKLMTADSKTIDAPISKYYAIRPKISLPNTSKTVEETPSKKEKTKSDLKARKRDSPDSVDRKKKNKLNE